MDSILRPEILYAEPLARPKCVDLFCGAGGLSIGFAMAGGEVLGSVDVDTDSIHTFKRNFPRAKHVACSQIENWEPEVRKGQVDVIIGGPPCQGFSLARGLRFVEDPRNRLYKDFVRIVNKKLPRWFVMENVPGITSIGDGEVIKQIIEDFNSIGYGVSYQVINMANFGVPQLRKRAIFVGNREGFEFVWPEQRFFDARANKTGLLFNDIYYCHNSVNMVLSDLNLPQGNYFSHRANSQMRGPRNRCAHTEPAFTLRVRGDEFALCEEPATSAFIPGPVPGEDFEYRAVQNDLQDILRTRSPSWAPKSARKVLKNSRKLAMVKGTRRLTLAEQARLQTFPDWFEFLGSTSSRARQIGNAVPPLFAYQLFLKIFSYL
jgi:DNA (cytosine-5)-methyltransferase 1